MSWLLGRYRSQLFPPWLLKGWRGEGKMGRNAWPAVVLICLWLLRWSEEGMSRLASVKRARTDLEWRAAMGLECHVAPPSERTLRDFERFLTERHPEVGTPRYMLLHEHIVRLCRDQGVISSEPIWAADSTPMWCYGAVLDTVRLLGDGLRQLGLRWALATRSSLEDVAQVWDLPLLLAKSTKGWFDIDWRDREDRSRVIDQLARNVVRVVTWVRKRLAEARPAYRKALLRHCRNLLRVISNDLETDEDGRLRVATRVGHNRLISLTDAQARHGRKSNSHRFNGFKVHILGELVSGLIASVVVTPGNLPDGAPTHRLVRRAKDLFKEIEQVLGDTAYGGARVRHVVQQTLAVDLLTPPPPEGQPKGNRLRRSDFAIDFDANTATCPGGKTTSAFKIVPHSDFDNLPAYRYRWSKQDCDFCPCRAACLEKGRRTKTVLLHPHEQELRAHRQSWQDPGIRKAYRRRGEFERLIHTVTRHGGRKARSWGLKAANAQAHAIVATSNLKLLAKALAEESAPDLFSQAA